MKAKINYLNQSGLQDLDDALDDIVGTLVALAAAVLGLGRQSVVWIWILKQNILKVDKVCSILRKCFKC